jgi:hypothetical protein
MILEDIKNYAKQFEYEPNIENIGKLKKFKKFVICGMGGSHLAADIIKAWHPEADIIIWSDYGLPPLPEKELKERLIIASSYSGGTEETIDAFTVAKAKHLEIAVIATYGKLITLAQKNKIPFVQLPNHHSQPRMATGLSFMAMLALMGEHGLPKRERWRVNFNRLAKSFAEKILPSVCMEACLLSTPPRGTVRLVTIGRLNLTKRERFRRFRMWFRN